jgi:UDP-N-acetylmuramyl pentapeptide phosphotransferase/UDP-N-acetylglucosamine-1-phosphate transferase
MLYYVGVLLSDQISVLNVLTYHTVRAGGAALTAFGASLVFGPSIIRMLRALKVGQYIRQEHVADLHALHKNKAGTPTMGGALIVVAAVGALLLWGRFENRLLLIALGATILLAAVGFLDDYIKLRRRHNQGLSATAKFTGQITVGVLMGIYLVANPITASATYLATHHVTNWSEFARQLRGPGGNHAAARFSELLPESGRILIDRDGPWSSENRTALVRDINEIFDRRDLFRQDTWSSEKLTPEARDLLARDPVAARSSRELVRLNRLLFEAAFPEVVAASPPNQHTKVEVPGLRMVLLPLGAFYALFVLLIIVAASNAVNLTDGLDGLAIGASIVSLLAYTGIAYVVSRSDWSDYLFLIHVPEASELTVFGAALLGAGLGFLWFNSHPAEVFMGDTGSLALGGALGTMAVLTKQELLLLIVGGLFVVEAASVIIQVLSYKIRGKRVFKMAPLHHHFELLGWSESKVIVRFWILAILFALLSLSTLKLR